MKLPFMRKKSVDETAKQDEEVGGSLRVSSLRTEESPKGRPRRNSDSHANLLPLEEAGSGSSLEQLPERLPTEKEIKKAMANMTQDEILSVMEQFAKHQGDPKKIGLECWKTMQARNQGKKQSSKEKKMRKAKSLAADSPRKSPSADNKQRRSRKNRSGKAPNAAGVALQRSATMPASA
ncbi:expressed unknown protein [Seminavis robusta]|uniref:Uncharacterized protein n=1 Tax=Seminavis robusta TaxID=568900 RepID=A0A9N8HXI9_9STRA|nr:expressed unknown protein [Seminavis robusta]|eukprot:Sro2510_g329830.1 n/a (179) ;mRNA; r:9926-10462